MSNKTWIKFEDREPKIGQEVIFGKNNMVEKDFLLKPVVTAGHYHGNGKFFSWLSKNLLTASHWKPMPILKNG